MREDAFTTEIQVRFRDIDTMGHVNNALYATYLEEARTAYFRDVLDTSLVAEDAVLATLEVDFRGPIEREDSVAVSLDVAELGESSIAMEYAVRTDDDLAATAETVQVMWDRDAGQPRPIPDDWRRRIEAHEDR